MSRGAEVPAGIIRINKPVGLTSRDIVNRLVRILGIRRVGHAGTLDPFAEGLLLVAWGRATALVPYLQDYSKCYEADATFGWITDTQDRTGTTLERREVGTLDSATLAAAMGRFRGKIFQQPPMFSALKVGGERLYDLARRGETVPREKREREVFAFELLDWTLPDARFRIVCEGGTYVRTLIHDLGADLGPGACVTRLRRSGIGPHRLEGAIPIDTLEQLDRAGVLERALTLGAALPAWPTLKLSDPEMVRQVLCGSWRGEIDGTPGTHSRILGPKGELLAVAGAGRPARLLRVLGEVAP